MKAASAPAQSESVAKEEIAGRTVECLHCRTPFRTTERETEFCCSGCRFVFHLVHKRGLEDFYQFGDRRAPVGAGVFHEREWAWLRALQETAEKTALDSDGVAGVLLSIQGISCAGCVWLLEAVFMEQPGAVSCRVDSSAGTMRLRWKPGETSLPAYAADVQRFGYLPGPARARGEGNAPLRPLVRRLGLCAALAMNAMLFALPRYLGIDPGDSLTPVFDAFSLLIATASFLIGGPVFFRRAWGALKRGDLHIDLPISIGLIVAYTGSVIAWRAGDHSFAYFDFVSIFTFLMLLGRWLQERSVENNRRRLLSMRITPGNVLKLADGIERETASEQIRAGDRYKAPRNGLVPVRSRLSGASGVFALNWINGEPAPREFPAGAVVPSGARSIGPAPPDFVALENWADSSLAGLLAFDTSQPWRNTALQKLIRIYLSFVLVVAALGFAGWIGFGGGWLAAVQVLVSVLVVSCPCAIGVALPLLDDVAAARLQPFGVYLREHSLWSRLRRVRNLLFDKTGTVTLEHLAPANPDSIRELPAGTRSILLGMVSDSLHPVAGCLREALLSAGVEPAPAALGAAREITGMGIELRDGHGLWRLGRASWAAPDAAADDSSQPGGTCLALDGVPVARFHFREELRADAADQIGRFLRDGFQVYLLSGDEPGKVRELGMHLGIPESHAFGGLSPEDKAALVKERWPGDSLMLGDGANDSLAFDAALCRGTPSVDTGLLEHKSDFYLLGRSLAGLGELFAMAGRHGRAGRAVFGFAITYNTMAVGVSLAGWMNPLLAAVIMPLSSLCSIAIVFALLRPGGKM